MKIATWNVNSIRSRQAIVLDWLTANPVDVLCLQETKVVDKDFPRDPFEAIGYQLAIAGQKSYNGVAIFSRHPMTEISAGFGAVLGEETDLDEQKRVISAVIGGVRVVNLYVPNGSALKSEKYDYKLRWLALLKTYLAQLQSSAVPDLCVCGDFNVAPDDRDIYKPDGKDKHIMASPPEREALAAVLSVGFTDIFRQFTPDGGHYSWWDYRQGGFANNRGWRIDHIYLTAALCDRAQSCTIDLEPRRREKPCDHTPVIVELRD
jgi:exodeoxyribonuclease-3